MYNQTIATHYKKYSNHIQNQFINGYPDTNWILKQSKETIVYCNKKELYRFDKRHTEFLKLIPLITNMLDQLEADLEKYYDDAAFNYDCIAARKLIIKIVNCLSEAHIFFQNQNNSLFFIRRVLYEHFCRMVKYRFAIYLQNHLTEDFTVTLQHLEEFRAEDRNFFNNLFLPIISLIEDNKKLKRSKEKREKEVKSNLNSMWNYFGYISHYNNTLNEYTKEDDLKKYCPEYIDYVQKSMPTIPILYKLKWISEAFTNYFSIFSFMQKYYPNTTSFHPYAVVLSNHSLYIKLIKSCTFYSSHQTMYEIIINYIKRTHNDIITFMDQVAKDCTDDIYSRLKDFIDADNATKLQITNELLTYYPNTFEKYFGAELIEFQFFEQLLAIELLDIIEANLIIKRCPNCNRYFIASSKKQKYCDIDKNKRSSYQKKHSSQYQAWYQHIKKKHDDCLRKRVQRGRLSKNDYINWKKDTDKIISSMETDISKKEFIELINSIYQKYQIPIPKIHDI